MRANGVEPATSGVTFVVVLVTACTVGGGASSGSPEPHEMNAGASESAASSEGTGNLAAAASGAVSSAESIAPRSEDDTFSSEVNEGGTSNHGLAPSRVTFRRIELTAEFLAEGANGGEFDGDGITDVVAGPYWYRGPDFSSRHVVYLPPGESEPVPFDVESYSDNFFSFVDDFNADGWSDVLVINFPGRDARWYENPQVLDELWMRHDVFDAVGNESPAFVDFNGDGQRELVFSSNGALGWAGPSTDPTDPWIFHALTPAAGFTLYDHGLGVGDVDSDGDMDLIEASGFWLQMDGESLWTKHEHSLGSGGAQMFAYDVDGDGDQDVVTTLAAHEYGVAWFERSGDASAPQYTKHLISPEQPGTDALFQPHALDVVDVNGDGLLDIVTGERFWAHVPEGSPDFEDPAKLVWYELRRDANGAEFVSHVIDNDSGVGTQVVAMDLTADDRPDIVVASKKGAFVFIQEAE